MTMHIKCVNFNDMNNYTGVIHFRLANIFFRKDLGICDDDDDESYTMDFKGGTA